MRRIRIYILATLATWVLTAASAGQSSPATVVWQPEPPVLQYNTSDGLSQGDVLSMVQDRAGHLWLATNRGLNRYDGNEFAHFTKADGLLYNTVTALLATESDQIWISDVNGNLILIDNNAVGRIISIEELESAKVHQIVEFNSSFVLATRYDGVFLVDPNTAEPKAIRISGRGEEVKDLTVHGNALQFVQGGSLMRWNGDPDSYAEVIREGVVGSFLHKNSDHWLVTSAGSIGLLTSEGFQARHQLNEGQTYERMVADSERRVWVGVSDGIFRYQFIEEADGQVREDFSDFSDFGPAETLFIDREGTLWIGKFGGLYRHLGNRFTHYKNRYSKNSGDVWSIAEDASGRFYFGTESTILRLNTDGGVSDYSSQLGLPANAVRDIVTNDYVELYASVMGAGLFKINTLNDTAVLIPGTEGLDTLDLLLNQDGVVWIATDGGGIVSVDTRNGDAVYKHAGTEGGSIYSLTNDPDGNIWYGVDNVGIGVIRPKEASGFAYDFYGSELGLDAFLYSHIIAVGVDELWIGGEDSILFHFKDGQIRDFTTDSPMRDQNIYTVFERDKDTLMLGGEQGVFLFNPETLESRGLGIMHGFLGAEVNVHSIYLDRSGYLWIGTIDGPTRMDLGMGLPDRVPVIPQIVSARSQLSKMLVAPRHQLEHSERGLQFTFDAVSLLEPFSIEYSFRLVGHNDEWSTPDRSRSVNYSGLSPGEYRFEVRARYTDGEWYESEEAFEFEMLAPFWRTNWFVLLTVVIAILIVYLSIWLRTRSVNRLNSRLREEVEERTRSIEEGRERLYESHQKLLAESEERRRADAARAEVEQRFRVAFQSTPIGMALVDAKGRVLNSNRALRKMFLPPKYHDDEDANLDYFNPIEGEEDRKKVTVGFMNLVRGQAESFDTEYQFTRYDGEVLFVHLFMTAIPDEKDGSRYCMAQVQDITESRRLTVALEYQANYDELSGLLNRRSFEKALDKAYTQSANATMPSYLMFMDLDQFKIVNDTSGHSAGDELLRQISVLIKDQVRNNDTVGRLGGDEFGLILWRCPTHVAYRIAEAIRSAVEQYQFQWGSNTYRVGMSIGAVTIDTALGTTAELQQLADAACYHSKDNGRNRVHFLQEEGESISEQRGEVRWVQRLHEAMDLNSFALYGQFIKPTDPTSTEPERMEILLRMRDHKTRKIIPPGAFMPAAERYGLITKLDTWVVENLLKMLYVHRSFGNKDRRYWINLSGTSVGDKRFVDYLIDAVKHSGLPDGMINFEITETAVIRNVGEAGRLMSSLNEMGCQFALDDFGSGLSSFGYLKKLPVDFIKIDGMFVRDILTDEIDRVFVRSIIDISRTMGIKSIAEFVENAAIRKAVGELGVDYVQGFGVHRPQAMFADLPSGTMYGASQIRTYKLPDPTSKEKLA